VWSGSDNTAERARALTDNVLHDTADVGPANKRNMALDATTGQYVMHLDADDWLEPGSLKHLVDALDKGAAWAYGSTKYWGKRSDVHVPGPYRRKDFYTGFPSLYAILRRRDTGIRWRGTEEWRQGIMLPNDYCVALDLIKAGYDGAFVPALVLHYLLTDTGLTKAHAAQADKVNAAIRKYHPEVDWNAA